MVLARLNMDAIVEFIEKAYSNLITSRTYFSELQQSMEAKKSISQKRTHELEETVCCLTIVTPNHNGSTS